MARQNRSTKSRSKNKEYVPSKPEIVPIHPKTYAQEELMESILSNPVTLASGMAGTGKTMVALYEGIKLLEMGKVDQILYTKPITDFRGEKGLGFLPGDEKEKTQAYLDSVRDNLGVFVTKGKAEYMLNKGQITFQPMEFIRGRSLRYKYVILDEAQNTTRHGVLTMLTRLEETSKIVVLGDPAQADVRHRGENDGLTDAISRLSGLSEVGIIKFSPSDIVRSGFLKNVINRYQ